MTTVAIDGTAYGPALVTVERGSRVVFRNLDPFPHTATAPGRFDSRSIPAGAAWSWTAREPGRYDYVCTLHPTMRGTIVVR